MKTFLIALVMTTMLGSSRVLALAPNERIFPGDGSIQVWVSGGTFTMGIDDPAQPDRPDERPPHTVTVDGFWMDKHEVTCRQFAEYFNKKLKEKTLRERVNAVELPILNWRDSGLVQDPKTGLLQVKTGCENWPALVPWHASQQYCEDIGKALPTEAQWEWAAKGADGRKYPWGNDWNPKAANVATDKIAPVGSFPKDATPLGIMDMAGNAREWCADKYEADYYKKSPDKNPYNWAALWMACDRAMRGGGYSVTEWDARTTSRNLAAYPYRTFCVGFRGLTGGEPPKGR